MNSALDSPLEALALNYLSYGFLTAINNIWAWIAVITAALSFWRMRPALPSTDRMISTSSLHDASTPPPPMEEEEEPAAAPAKASPSCRVLERQGSTKMKFSLYYKEEVEEQEQEEEDYLGRDDDGGENEERVVAAVRVEAWGGDWEWEWERVVAMRMGDMGWYRWQDRRRVLDGNVVRLWEGRRHAAAQVVCGGAAW